MAEHPISDADLQTAAKVLEYLAAYYRANGRYPVGTIIAIVTILDSWPESLEDLEDN